MTLYLDSSALVKLYVFEEHSANVALLAQRPEVAFAVNGLHELEIRNAVRLLRFRNVIDDATAARAIAALDADLATDLFVTQPLDFGRLANAGERLSSAATILCGAGALDILHVAAAQIAGCSAFVTFDLRQREVARIAGLSILEIAS